MEINWKNRFEAIDPFGMLLSLSAPILGILLAVADYHVAWATASSLVLTVIVMHIYMSVGNRLSLAASVAGAFLTVYLSYGSLISLESLLLLLFAYFVIRLAKGAVGSAGIVDGVITCILYGPVALIGTYFVCTHSFGSWILVFPALSWGLLCLAVSGLGKGYAELSVSVLIVAALVLLGVYSFMRVYDPAHFIYAVMIPVFLLLIVKMHLDKNQADSIFRRAFSVCVLVLSLLTGIGFVAYLF